MDSKTVAELVLAAREGSPEARDELVRRHHRQAALIAAAMVNDPTEAEDLAQEAFIRAFRNLDLLGDPSRFAPWLRRIVVGVSIDWLRAFRPALYQGWSDGDEASVPSASLSPLDLVLRSEMTETGSRRPRGAAAAISCSNSALSPRWAQPREDCGCADVPVGTVRSLVARARAKLMPLLAEYAPDARPPIHEVFDEGPVTDAARRRFLHVANGSSTTMTMESAGIPGAYSIWADPLHDGPVPGELTDAELMEVRARNLGPADAPEHDMRLWREPIEQHDAWDELILWYEHDLFDQLNLIQLLSFIRERVPASKPVSLICIGSFPGRPDFHGLGELNADELASLLETRQPVGDAQYELARRAWQAFRNPTPEALDNLRQTDTSPLPYLADAITRFLQEYPWTRDGLSRSERRLLSLAEGDGVALWKVFPRMHEGERAYYVSDESLTAMVKELSGSTPPLLTLDMSGADGRVLRGTVALTEAGRSVLTGQLDRVAACGFDRWYGGVHLHRGGPMWRWDDAKQTVVKE